MSNKRYMHLDAVTFEHNQISNTIFTFIAIFVSDTVMFATFLWKQFGILSNLFFYQYAAAYNHDYMCWFGNIIQWKCKM